MFKDFELSPRGGRPTHLFLFTRQGVSWRYAQCDHDLTFAGKTYLSAPIARGEIKQTVEPPKDRISITIPYNRDPANADPVTQPLGDNWFPFVPSDPVQVTCLATHLGDPDQQLVVEWIGIVVQPKFSDGKLELVCQPASSIGRAQNQGAKWQRSCWKSVYSTGLRGCNLVAEAIPVQGTLTEVSGNTITAAEFVPPQRTFVGGTATWIDSGSVAHTANITAAAGTTLTLDDVTGLAAGSVVTANTTSLITTGAITAMDGLTLTVAEFAGLPLSLAGGYLWWTRDDGIIERRSIMAQAGSTVTLLYGGRDLAIGRAVSAVPGCEHTWQACAARGNTVNYGGAIYKPVQNPYNGRSMSWG